MRGRTAVPAMEKALLQRCWYTACAGTADGASCSRESSMFWTLLVLLLVLWVVGFMFDIAGGLIHVWLVAGLVLFAVNLISGRRRVA